MKIAKDPNVSIVLPGCNANCAFCFINYNKAVVAAGWLEQLERNLNALPKDFWQISITGGEPLISKHLVDVLNVIDRSRWKKVVLTTNALSLDEEVAGRLRGKVDHVNISRYSSSNSVNVNVFGVYLMPTDAQLRRYISILNIHGIDVTFNCVLRPCGLDEYGRAGGVYRYIAWARGLGAQAVSFRKQQTDGGDLEPTAEEKAFTHHKVINETRCPVCRSKTQLINGMKVIWKAALHHRDTVLPDKVHELIWQPSGEFTLDWGGKFPLMKALLRDNDIRLRLDLGVTKGSPVDGVTIKGRPHSPREIIVWEWPI